jgi:ParB-like chromosome segregation protein Spo0J
VALLVGVVDRWVEQISNNLLDEGVMKNPIVVTRAGRKKDQWIVIDGMHRFAALKELEIPHIVVYEVDYQHADIALAGWDTLVFRPFKARHFLQSLSSMDPHDGTCYHLERVERVQDAQSAVDAREALVAVTDRHGPYYLLRMKRRATVDQCVQASRTIDMALDAQGYRPLYALMRWPSMTTSGRRPQGLSSARTIPKTKLWNGPPPANVSHARAHAT